MYQKNQLNKLTMKKLIKLLTIIFNIQFYFNSKYIKTK